MIVEQNFLEKLKDFGINSYEAKIWTALLSRGVANAGELSDISNVPRSRAYDVLESLEKKGFIIMKLGKPIKYVAVSPEEVLSRVKKKIENDKDSQIKMVDELKESDILKELTLLHTQGIEKTDPSELSGSLKGREISYNQMSSMLSTAKESVSILTSAEGLIRKADSLKRALKKAKENGVKVKILAQINKKNEKVVKQLKDFAEVKHTDLKGRFMIADRKEIVFMLMDDISVHPNYDVGVWVKTPVFAEALQTMFDINWGK